MLHKMSWLNQVNVSFVGWEKSHSFCSDENFAH